MRPRRVIIGVAAAALLLAACGGSEGESSDGVTASAESGEQLPQDGGGAEAAEGESTGAQPAVAPASGQVDLVGPDVIPAAEIETNLLPAVVLDDVSRGMKVNFRNLVPQDKPILLWAYAPH